MTEDSSVLICASLPYTALLPDETPGSAGSCGLRTGKSAGRDRGPDACRGLYDEYYPLYIELGLVPS